MRSLVVVHSLGSRSEEVAADFRRSLEGRPGADLLVIEGSRKAGLRHAVKNGYDAVIPVDCADPYPASGLPDLLAVFEQDNSADAVLGVRPFSFYPAGFLSFFLSRLQSFFSGVRLLNWNASCCAYRTRALAKTAFELNAPGAQFDAELLLQLADQRCRLVQKAFPWLSRSSRGVLSLLGRSGDLVKATLKYRLQRYNLFYDVRFHPEFLFESPGGPLHRPVYGPKFDVQSPHSSVCRDAALVPPGSRVLDVGCSTGYVARTLAQERGCRVTGVDLLPDNATGGLSDYHRIDVENEFPRLRALIEEGGFDVVLVLDVLEHLAFPELFMLNLCRISYGKKTRFVFSTGNVAFFVVRAMLMLGYFNYGEKGILDVTHRRLFSVRTFKNLLDQTGFRILERRFFPVPYPSLGFSPRVSRCFEILNRGLIRLTPSLFAYQVMFVAEPLDLDMAQYRR